MSFTSYITVGTPLVIEGALENWPARNWTLQSLKERVGTNEVNVRVNTNCEEYRVGIGGSKGGGGRAGRRPPLQDPILSFLHTFSPKSTHVGVHAPLNRSTLPLWEILDPPLVGSLHK